MAPAQSQSAIKPKRYHGYAVFLFIMGTLFPPLAVAARFGLGSDFWTNLLCTICGYFPGHAHNFYIQNVRNNKNHSRTPKWAQRYGLVDTSVIKRHEQRSQWASRYNDRNPHSTLEDQPYEAGQHSSSLSRQDSTAAGQPQRPHDDLWHQDEESFYNAERDSNSVHTAGSGTGSGRWHYPANFEDAIPSSGGSKKKKKKDKKDRWARTEDAYSLSEQSGSKKKKKKKSKSSVGDGDTYSRHSGSTTEFPEDAGGGLYDSRRDVPEGNGNAGNGHAISTTEDVFSHEL
ncbi:hypothetical protein SERLA73DRAFT_191059 [Serpula lacrymans var. lacrymans S7.3]|uniref:Stress response RCI peptide n=2 Tax=Serpula lacrymans var. lacrymans TaxID=341189 RepID=F8QGV0_SERL3|nr:uncharacterized protein SERLADRAFT_480650 [Serpula lacrymans var. lacrymans S7.9]EGN92432.1 hypothetical protein SERLA73DRAFT_191059 [Serpula lacrymans var. lacrymans S7.3]EGO18558.1 hypothetical protein SERLADRAFT_480650 [Serpula lacrymans var. lacrymans S7.9]